MEARVKPLIPLKQGINVNRLHPQREQAAAPVQPRSPKQFVLLSKNHPLESIFAKFVQMLHVYIRTSWEREIWASLLWLLPLRPDPG